MHTPAYRRLDMYMYYALMNSAVQPNCQALWRSIGSVLSLSAAQGTLLEDLARKVPTRLALGINKQCVIKCALQFVIRCALRPTPEELLPNTALHEGSSLCVRDAGSWCRAACENHPFLTTVSL